MGFVSTRTDGQPIMVAPAFTTPNSSFFTFFLSPIDNRQKMWYNL